MLSIPKKCIICPRNPSLKGELYGECFSYVTMEEYYLMYEKIHTNIGEKKIENITALLKEAEITEDNIFLFNTHNEKCICEEVYYIIL